MKKTFFTTVLKSQLLVLIFLFFNMQEVAAQGYIDCATILNDSEDWQNGAVEAKSVNGYTYLMTSPWYYDPSAALPVINGESILPGSGEAEAYLAIFDPNCNQILGTYMAGDGAENADNLEIDASGNAYVIGNLDGTSTFMTTDGTTPSNSDDLFLRKYAQDGTLLFSTVYNTGNFQDAYVVVDGTDVYVVGHTNNSSFPTTDGTTNSGSWDQFLLKYDGAGNLVYATILGGSSSENDHVVTAVNGCAIVTGNTQSSDFPSTDGTTFNGARDGILTKYDPSGNIVFSTVYGGSSSENTTWSQTHLNSDGTFIYVTGKTESTDFITTDGTTYMGGAGDTYVQKYDMSGNLIFSTILGGSDYDITYDVILEGGNLYIAGETRSSDFPTTDGTTYNGGNSDAFLVKMDTNGNTIYSTLYGSTGSEALYGIYVDPSGTVTMPLLTYGSGARTTDGTTSPGQTFVRYNSDGTLCAASVAGYVDYENYTSCPGVVEDTIYFVTSAYDFGVVSTDGTAYTDYANSEEFVLTKFVFCPPTTPITSDLLSPNAINVCQNGLIEQINGEALTIDGSSFPPIYVDGVVQDQADIPLSYQWQVANTSTGPWTDIPGPLGQQQNYSPAPTTSNTYYRRLTSTSECCGGTLVSTSDVASVLVSGDTAPTVDAGGTFYTCPGDGVTIGGTTTGGTPAYAYNWDDSTYLVANPMVAPTVSSIYTLLVTDANGCMQTDQATVTVYTADAGTAGDVCEGTGISIGGEPLAGVTVVPLGSPSPGVYSIAYDWSPKDGSLSCTDCPNPTATPGTATDYTLNVTLYRPDGSSCTASDMVSVGVISAPSITEFSGPDTVLCLGESAVLGTTMTPLSTILASAVTDHASTVYTVGDFSDNDPSTGASLGVSTSQYLIIDLGQDTTFNFLNFTALSGDDFRYVNFQTSSDGSTWTTIASNTSSVSTYTINQEITTRYIRLIPRFSCCSANANLSEFSATYDYSYIWTPGDYIATNGSTATFDAGNLEMPDINPVTYTVTANLGTCNFYDQVTVAVIEARAGEDACGPRYVGEEDRTPGIEETYSWVKISDPGITTGTGDFLGGTDEAQVPVSASTGGSVGYELTVSYTLPSGVTGVCKDTVIVPPLCGDGCDVEPFGGGCPDFEDGNAGLISYPPDGQDTTLWTISWDSDLGMTGLSSYNTQVVYLTDNVTRTYTVTFTSVLDPTYTCADVIVVNSPSFSTPGIDATGGTVCKGDSIIIGDPSFNSGLTYSWTNEQFLSDPTINNPKASPSSTTEFIITAVDNSTGCEAKDTITVIVPSGANAGVDLAVCDNGTVTIGANTDTLGFTYSWEPVGAAWEPGYDHTDAQPEVFVATTTEFILTATDTSGTCITKDTMMVFVDNLPPTFMLPDLNFCPSSGTPLYLGTSDGTSGTNLVPDSSGYTFLWSPSTVSDATVKNPTVNTLPTAPTTYTVVVRTPNGGCNQTATQTIIPTVSQALVGGNQSICLGESVQIGDDANPTGGGETYSWSPSTDLDDAASANPTFTSSATGSFTYTVTKDIGGCTTTTEVTITVTEATAPTLTPQTICEGESVQIGVANNSSLLYSWSPSTDLDDPYISNPTFSGTSTANYTLTVIDGNGCLAETYTSVTVNPAPAVTINMPDTVLCDVNTSSVVLNPTVSPAGSYAYQWSPNTNLSNASALNPTLFVTGEGNFEYVFSLTDQGTGCTITDTLDLVVEFFAPVPIATVDADTICNGGAANLSVSVSEAIVLYQWQSSTTDCTTGFTDIGGADASAYAATGLTQETHYRVIVTDLTGECRDTSDCITVAVENCCPNVTISASQENCTDNTDGTFTANYDIIVEWIGGNFVSGEMLSVTQDGALIGTIDPNTVASPQMINVNIAANGTGTQFFKVEFTVDDCLADSISFKTPVPCPNVATCSSASGCLGGIAFEDFNCNGADEASEAGIQGVQVVIYDCNNNAVDTVWTDSDGDWQLCGLTDGEAYRVEFILPESIACWASPTHSGSENGTDVQFLTAPACTKFGLSNPNDYCEGDPYIIIPCFSDGPYDGGNSAEAAIVKLRESAEGHDFTGTGKDGDYKAMPLASHNDVGAVYGVAWQPTKERYYLSAFHKRYVGFGPDGPDAIYQYDLNGNKTGTINLDALLSGTNTTGGDVHDFTPAVSPDPHVGEIYDLGPGDVSFDAVGKHGFGDIELSTDNNTLYVVNLFDKKIYALDVSSGNTANTTVIQTWDTPDATGAGRNRPFALASHQGKLWIGSVDENGSNAYVHSLVPTTTTFNLELTIPLDYSRQAFIGGDAFNYLALSNWNAWATTSNVAYGGAIDSEPYEIGFPQPILSDIEFADNGDMILGFRDRFGDQSGAGRFLNSSETFATYSISAGDILKACLIGGNYVLENDANCDGEIKVDTTGPGGSEFYSWDFYNYQDPWSPHKIDADDSGGFHWETTQGGLLQIKGNPYVITTAMDPYSDYSGGLLKLNNTTGGREGVNIDSSNYANLVGGYTLFETGDFSTLTLGNISFGKANGLGDLEAACAPAPLEIGNYVWCDSLQNGIQDACERGIDNMLVQLYDEDGDLVGQDTTVNGQYYFNQENVDTTGIMVDGTPNIGWSGMGYSKKYYIVFGANQYDNGTGLFTVGTETYQGITTTDAGSNDNIDSDVDGSSLSTAIGDMPANLPVICMTTDAIGCGNHRYDMGVLCLPCGEIENLITERTICSGELVDSLAITTTYENPDSIAFVYFTSAQTDSIVIYTGGTGIDTVQIASANDTVGIYNVSGFTNNNVDNSPDTFYVYAIAHPTPQGIDCRPYEEIKVIVNACDWGDLQDISGGTAAADYQTLAANNGPVHVITPGLSLGSTVDGEPDGQPSMDALGDGVDEDGLTIFPTLDISPGSTFRLPLSYTNTTGMDAEIEAWIDWNNNGEFDAGEMVYNATNPTATFIEVTTPNDAVTGEFLGVRIRISNEDNMTPYGRMDSGEVEDYLIGLDCEIQICIPINSTINRE